MKTLTTIVCAFGALTATSALAEQVTLVAGSGGEGGTYYPVMQEIANVCDSANIDLEHRIVDGKSMGGSDNNIRGILRNKIPLGLAQLDKAHLELQKNPNMARVQALLPLHNEAVHFLVPTQVTVELEAAEEGGLMGWGAKEAVYGLGQNPLEQVRDLEGGVVVSWGGSVTSAKFVDSLADIGFSIMKVGSKDEALAALANGQAHALASTVGWPAAWIENLPEGQYKLLEFSDRTLEDLQDVYGTTGVSYDNLGSSGQQIDTISIAAVLFTREFSKPEMVNALAELQACVRANIGEFKDTLGTHAAWQEIDPSREMKWQNVFEAPAGYSYRVNSLSAPVVVQPASTAADDG